MPIVLTASDARALYIQDIMTMVAAPQGLVVQLRYDKQYVNDKLWDRLKDETAITEEALMAFVGDIRTPGQEYIIPVRMVKIIGAKLWGERAAIIRVEAGGYPDLATAGWPDGQGDAGKGELIRKGREAAQLVASGSQEGFRSAVETTSNLSVRGVEWGEKQWLAITSRLSALDPFVNSYFLHVDLAKSKNPKERWQLKDGAIKMRSRQGLIVKCYYNRATPPAGTDSRELSLAADNTILAPSFDAKKQILSRYDEVDFAVQSKPVTETARTIATISMPGEGTGEVTTKVPIPIVVTPLLTRIQRGFAGAAGAFFVALPAVMGAGSNFGTRAAFALLGTLIVAMLASVFSA